MLRYPVLWERCSSKHPAAFGWEWHDQRLARLQELGITPIAGLLHHGSGPGEGLLDPALPDGLAAHASRVARRYPHLRWWTPVNEPQTTARFGCLYGLWHPHLRDESAFLRAVANQCRAVLLSMRAIRAINASSAFVHTEDVGRVFSTAPLTRQAAFENERRWLSLDLLTGRLDRHHPWRERLERAGVPVSHLDELASGEAAPDLLGINHYVTSDRFLDHRRDLYPGHMRGTNYVDTEAARVDLPPLQVGWVARLSEVWERYRRPMAVTEAYLSCIDTHEQVRWLLQVWTACQDLRAQGMDICAVTAWALFGHVDWDSLLCARRDRYEPGAFNVRQGDAPKPTLLADAVRALAGSGHYEHEALDRPGWWQRGERLFDLLRA